MTPSREEDAEEAWSRLERARRAGDHGDVLDAAIEYLRARGWVDRPGALVPAVGRAADAVVAANDPDRLGLAVEALDAFPSCVAFTIFIDTCFSGMAIPALKPLAGNHRRVTLITGCGPGKTCPSGQGPPDSPTEDFIQGAGRDLDGDGTAGDLGDRFESMEDQSGGLQPQRWTSPKGADHPLE